MQVLRQQLKTNASLSCLLHLRSCCQAASCRTPGCACAHASELPLPLAVASIRILKAPAALPAALQSRALDAERRLADAQASMHSLERRLRDADSGLVDAQQRARDLERQRQDLEAAVQQVGHGAQLSSHCMHAWLVRLALMETALLVQDTPA